MGQDDSRSTEKSAVIESSRCSSGSSSVGDDGTTTVLRESVPVLADEVVDAWLMRVGALREFLTAQVAGGQGRGRALLGALKATMMKVSDPMCSVTSSAPSSRTPSPSTATCWRKAGLTRNDGLGDILRGIARCRGSARDRGLLDAEIADGPALAMVDSDKGITNLHVPSDVIVDASMPAMIRTSGHMWGPDGQEHDTLAVMPDSSYSGIYSPSRRLPGRRRLIRPPWARSRTWSDGAEGRGVRLARQDVRDPDHRRVSGSSTGRERRPRAGRLGR